MNTQPKINVIKNIENSEKTEIDIQITKEFATESLNSYNGWITGFKYYVLVIILVCVLPYSTSYIIDEHSGFLKYSILKSSRRSAIICKSIVNAIIGGITTSIPPILSLIIMIKQYLQMKYQVNIWLDMLILDHLQVTFMEIYGYI